MLVIDESHKSSHYNVIMYRTERGDFQVGGIQGFEWSGVSIAIFLLLLVLGVAGLFFYFVCKWLKVTRSK
jgi:hypothetical protein